MHEELRFELPNDLRELARVDALAGAFLERQQVEPHVLYATRLVLEEALSNVIRHGYADEERHEISVCLRVRGGSVELSVEDDGREFDPLSAREVDVRAPLEERPTGGLGLHLLRSMASEVRYQRTAGRNLLLVRI